MTRMCRAQFEHDDVDEANLVCNLQGVAFQGIQTDAQNLNDPIPCMPCPKVRNPSVLSWRLPDWIDFSYATVRSQYPRHRQPSPIHPQNLKFCRAKPHHDFETLRKTPPSTESPREKCTDDPLTEVSGPVVKHAPPVPWDDETTVDLPYDNPFYTRKFDNVLWLPRDPFGTLNLDDTVDLRFSLSVDVAAGQLETWSNLNENVYAEHASDKYSPGLGKKSSTGSLRQINGTENIKLPPGIARRIECKGDVESTLRSWRPSTSRRKSIGATSTSIDAGTVRRPPALRGDSLPEDLRGLERGRTSSIFAAAQSNSYIAVQGSLPQVHGQVLSLHTNDSISRLSNVSCDIPTNITARQAIFNEILAEERAVMVDQNEDENQAQKAASGKSWLTAWMFNRRE
ncbi:hypothetical protein C0993_006508 [Termitomyces sp. T159_Od127]|nr:hypothetical protein C0993_006508 [Termitomyces sp. T159_Od127]